jgi:hypothetical protein
VQQSIWYPPKILFSRFCSCQMSWFYGVFLLRTSYPSFGTIFKTKHPLRVFSGTPSTSINLHQPPSPLIIMLYKCYFSFTAPSPPFLCIIILYSLLLMLLCIQFITLLLIVWSSLLLIIFMYNPNFLPYPNCSKQLFV